jgi:thioredoxin reductase (NADPH)
MKKESYDFVIIGAGVTGMAAAMYAARLGLKTLCLGASSGGEMPIGGLITTTENVENYPGFPCITGAELAEKIRNHAACYELAKIRDEKVEKIEKSEKGFAVRTGKKEYIAKTLLFATGVKIKKLEIPGSREFENKGVSYCALCDGLLFKGKVVAVVGGANSAAKNAMILAEHAKKVYILYRGEKMKIEQANLKELEKNKKIEIVYNVNVKEIKGDRSVSYLVLDKEVKGGKKLEVSGVFIAIGYTPNSELAKSLGVKTNKAGEIVIDYKNAETNVAGAYAAGNVADRAFKQAVVGVAEGCVAAYSAFEHITKNKIEL